jgi:hypothetical protein
MNTNILLYTEKYLLLEDINYSNYSNKVDFERDNCILDIPEKIQFGKEIYYFINLYDNENRRNKYYRIKGELEYHGINIKKVFYYDYGGKNKPSARLLAEEFINETKIDNNIIYQISYLFKSPYDISSCNYDKLDNFEKSVCSIS